VPRRQKAATDRSLISYDIARVLSNFTNPNHGPQDRRGVRDHQATASGNPFIQSKIQKSKIKNRPCRVNKF
jgi:hypothetical protein